ncbi:MULTISPECIES: hypothetical protein [Clostridium]|uniref:Uncharacterized protein n=1 Tax=Clostridium frigoriphilum TaxID=443253 RepID=A0ABU7UQA4_9CLOT|nr:hypothetical protein [Clostridium sp. DSM 17811]MBU3100681.1 hypothetical protein [Clostridium sp. DSM 17811]
MSNEDIFESTSAMYIRDYAYKHGNSIYAFMDQNNIGKSMYGTIMDSAAKGKGVMAHRLYGHHLIYNFPLNDIKNAAPFLEHLFSDLFTKQGLPIIPSEILDNLGLLKCCDKLKGSWNFVNGFDILAGTVAIYQGIDKFKKTFLDGMSVDNFEDLANTLGIGALELAIAISTANPFLLIAGILYLTSGLKGMLNEGSVIYFKNIHQSLSIEFSVESLKIEKYIMKYSLKKAVNEKSLEEQMKKIRFPYKY